MHAEKAHAFCLRVKIFTICKWNKTCGCGSHSSRTVSACCKGHHWRVPLMSSPSSKQALSARSPSLCQLACGWLHLQLLPATGPTLRPASLPLLSLLPAVLLAFWVQYNPEGEAHSRSQNSFPLRHAVLPVLLHSPCHHQNITCITPSTAQNARETLR